MIEDTTRCNDPFIWYVDDVLPLNFCDHVIKRFEEEKKYQKGETIGDQYADEKYALGLKKSLDFVMNTDESWNSELEFLKGTLVNIVESYEGYITRLHLPNFEGSPKFTINPFRSVGGQGINDNGLILQKTRPKEGYGWHHDFWVNEHTGIRILTVIFYLNTVSEGWTEFFNGSRISPRRGRVLLFPSTWNYIHQGYPPKDDKYIITSWLSKELPEDKYFRPLKYEKESN